MPQTNALKIATTREDLFTRIATTVFAALTRRRERAMLARLDLHLLRDIGLDPNQALAEAEKPCWRA